ncbi:putative uncharacterized protein DDB_G0282133 isoform X1 [Drosophila simulans]|uniref:Uncharacterized protein, isoform B n=1 Tax=Drosophila simulans TaxID=7240 RepID=A0A0J9TM83_DROSI|nr:putative uncharacterized protein DDB_G0282133 isoform X1 [Drosophila simulans]KMY89960.1 uncharacterized protein Dsimw501_GD22098, isoform B [Drosophila simulans]
MSRRSNFIEGNDNFRDQNLRFVRNEFEDNINQFFGGADPGGSGPQQKPPPRDSLIVQPTAGNSELDNRRQFLRDLGASRVLANAMAQRTFNVPKFNLRHFQRQRFRLSVELGDSHQDVVDKKVLRAIEEAVDSYDDVGSRPRTPSPPRNIDWHSARMNNSPANKDRSRSNNRQREDNFADNNRGVVEQREPINRNTGPGNRNNPGLKPAEFNRNRNANAQDFNRNNRNMDRSEFNQNNRNVNPNFNRNEGSRPNPQEFRGPNRNTNAQEFNRNNRNQNHQDFNRSNRNQNPQEFNRPNRNQNPQDFNRPNRNQNPQDFNRSNRNQNPQDFNRYNRNANPQEFNRNIRNDNEQEFNHNRNAVNDEFNRNNRNVNNQTFHQGHNQNNRNANAQFNRKTFDENRNFNNQRFQGPNNHINYRGQMPNYDHSQVNNNRRHGNQNFVSNQQTNLDRNAICDDGNQLPRDRFRSPEAHPQQPPYPRNVNANLAGGNRGPQKRHNYQRIVNDNQIILRRTDWIDEEEDLDLDLDHHDMDDYVPDERELLEDADFIDDTNDALMNDDQYEEREFNRYSRGNQHNNQDHNIDDRNSYGHNRNDRNFEGMRRQFDPELDRRNLNDNFNQRNNSSRGGDTLRFPPREDDTFQGSNNPNFPPNYQHTIPRRSGSGNRGRDTSSNRPMGPNQNRRSAPNADEAAPRGAHSGAPIQDGTNSNRKINKNVNPGRVVPNRISAGTPNQPRSNSTTSQTRNVNPGVPNKNVKKSTVPHDNRAPQQNKPVNTNPGASKPGQPVNKPKPQATKINAAMAKPLAGQKRKAETPKLGGATKAEPKRQRAETDRSFIISGISLPYINSNTKELPQPEEQSYAVTFFEQTPIYNTNIYATDDGHVNEDESDAEEEEMSDAESLDSNRSGVLSKWKGRSSRKKVRTQLRKEWTKIYRTNNYKDWFPWWRDYKWCGSEINKKLEKFGDRNLRHRFAPIGRKPMTVKAINQIFKSGHMGLEKNTFSHYRNMRSIFILMNEKFLHSLSNERLEQLQDLIRGVPNHLWLYKIRSMVYLWERYHSTLKTHAGNNFKSDKEIQSIAREWKSPVFHWLAKQAFDELKAISEIAWPDHTKIYPGLKS